MTKREYKPTKRYKCQEEVRTCPPSSLFLLAIPLMLILWMTFGSMGTLVLRDPFTGDLLWMGTVRQGEDIQVCYTHSVERTEVCEIYEIGKGELLLMEEHFKSLGAGLPASAPHPFERTKDGYRYYDMNISFPNVIYRTGASLAEHQLVYRGKRIPFLEFSEPGGAVELSIQRISPFHYLYWRCKANESRSIE